MKKGLVFLTTFVLFVSILQTFVFGEVYEKFSESDWYADNVKKCYELGLINGKKAGYFDSYGNVTLAEAITIASMAHEIYCGGDGVIDNAGIQWYDGVIVYAEIKIEGTATPLFPICLL